MNTEDNKNRPGWRCFLAGFAAAALSMVLPATGAAQVRPNVLFIMADDLGLGDLEHYYPDSPVATPNISALAAAGITFTHFRAAAPVCTPSRAALMTGQDPARLGLRSILGSNSTGGLGAEVETLAEIFNGAGYFTAHIGKWHLGLAKHNNPIAAGFQTASHTVNFYLSTGLYTDSGLPVVHGEENTAGKRQWEKIPGEEVHTTSLYADRAAALIQSSVERGQPFFINLWFHNPHVEGPAQGGRTPWHLPPSSPRFDSEETTPAQVYIELVEYLDLQVGRVLDALEQAGVSDNTLVVMTSDNGGLRPRGENFLPWSNAGLRGSKNLHYEGGLRVPFIVRWPGQIEAGSSSGDFAVSEDVFATFADLLGVESANTLDGVSLMPTLLGRSNPAANSRTVVFEGADLDRTGDVDDSRPYDHAVIENGRWKMVSIQFGKHKLFLFDLAEDPFETTNLWSDPAQAQRVAALSSFYRQWSLETSRAELSLDGRAIETQREFDLDGDQAVKLDPHPVFDFGNSDFTLSLELIADSALLSEHSGVTVLERPGSFSIRVLSGGRVEARFHNSENETRVLQAAESLVAGEPTQVAITLKGWVQGAEELRQPEGRLYIDSERVALQSLGSAAAHIVRTGEPLLLGGRGASGKIRALQVFNRTLTGQELTTLR